MLHKIASFILAISLSLSASSGLAQTRLFSTEEGALRITSPDLQSEVLTLFSEGNAENFAVDSPATTIYWTDDRFERILSTDILSGETTLLYKHADGLDRPTGIFFEPGAQQLYWTDRRSIFTAPADGTGPVTSLYTTFAGGSSLQYITADVGGGFVYWIDPDAGGPGVYRAPLDGSGPIQLLFAGPVGRSIALHIPSGRVFWDQINSVFAGNIDGSGVPTLLYGPADGISNGVTGIAIDSTDGRLFVNTDNDTPTPTIRLGDVNGVAGLTVLFDTVSDGLGSPSTLIFDKPTESLFWLDTDNDHDFVRTGPSDGSTTPSDLNLELFIQSIDFPRGVTFHYPTGDLIWSEEGSGIFRIPTNRSEAVTVIYDFNVGFNDIAMQGVFYDLHTDTVVWTNFFSSAIGRVNADGSGNEVILYDFGDGVCSPKGVTMSLDGSTLYWVDDCLDTINQAPSDGNGPVTTIYDSADGVSVPVQIQVLESTGEVIWSNAGDNTIRKGLLTGATAPEILYTSDPSTSVFGVAVDEVAGNLYWTEDDGRRLALGSTDGTRAALFSDLGAGLLAALSIAIDSDSDGTFDVTDECPLDSGKVIPGSCGCGVADTDSDMDSTPDCQDSCPADANKTEPLDCGCGVAENACICTTDSLAPEQLSLDSVSADLLAITRRALKIQPRLARNNNCRPRSAASRRSLASQAEALHASNWSTIWGQLPGTVRSCPDSLPLNCTPLSFSSEFSSISETYEQQRELVFTSLGRCLRRQRKARRLRRQAKAFLDAGLLSLENLAAEQLCAAS